MFQFVTSFRIFTLFSSQEWSGWRTSDSSWSEGVWNEKWDKVDEEKSQLERLERSEGVIDAVVSWKVTRVFQEDTWNDDEKATIGLLYNFGGTYFCAVTGDKESEHAKNSGPRRLFQGE